MIFFSEKLLDESGGEAFNNSGGMESLKPPSGGMILAQPGPLITLITLIKMITGKDIIEIFFIECKHRPFQLSRWSPFPNNPLNPKNRGSIPLPPFHVKQL